MRKHGQDSTSSEETSSGGSDGSDDGSGAVESSWDHVFQRLVKTPPGCSNQESQLHQKSGWCDIDDSVVWKEYVADMLALEITQIAKMAVAERPGTEPVIRIFEAGCGVLAFLQALHSSIGPTKLHLAGFDSNADVVVHIPDVLQQDFDPTWLVDTSAKNFFVGYLPDALELVAEASYDVALSHSVFQYLRSADSAEASVNEMLRVVKPGGLVFIGDVIDSAFEKETHAAMIDYWSKHDEEYGVSVPRFLTFSKSWWSDRFAYDAVVDIRHTTATKYWRGTKQRYCVYLRKFSNEHAFQISGRCDEERNTQKGSQKSFLPT